MKFDISVRSIFSKAFQDYVNNWKILTKIVLLFFPIFVISALMRGVSIFTLTTSQYSYFDTSSHYSIVIFIMIAFEIVYALMMATALDIVFKRPCRGIFFSQRFVYFFIARMLYWIASGFGLILFIFPGIYLFQSLKLAPLLVLEDKVEILDSLKASLHITKGYVGSLMWIGLVTWFVTAVADATFIGMLIAVPFAVLIEAHLYKTFQEHVGLKKF